MNYSSDFKERRLRPYKEGISKLGEGLRPGFYREILPVIVKIGFDSYFTKTRPEARVSFNAESITQEEKDALTQLVSEGLAIGREIAREARSSRQPFHAMEDMMAYLLAGEIDEEKYRNANRNTPVFSDMLMAEESSQN